MKVGDVVIRPLVTVGPRDFARHAESLMDDFGLTMLPVVDRDVFLGVVTKAGCLRGKPGVPSPHVEQVMSAPVLTAGLDLDIETLFDAMTVYEVSCVPVLDERRVAGVVTDLDLLRAISLRDEHLRVSHAGHHG